MHVSISFSCEEEYNDLSRSLAKFSSELILHLHGSGDGGGGVYAEVGGGGRFGSSWCSKCMFLILSVNQPGEINYMI